MPAGALRLWFYCLLMASHQDYPESTLKRGQLRPSYAEIRKATGMGRTQVADALRYLEDRGYIRREPGAPHRRATVTVCKYRRYQAQQSGGPESGLPSKKRWSRIGTTRLGPTQAIGRNSEQTVVPDRDYRPKSGGPESGLPDPSERPAEQGVSIEQEVEEVVEKNPAGGSEPGTALETTPESPDSVSNRQETSPKDRILTACVGLGFILLPSPYQVERLTAWVDEGMDANLVIWAMEQALTAGRRGRVDYVEAILRRLAEDGVTARAEAEARQRAWQQERGRRDGHRKKSPRSADDFADLYIRDPP